MCTLKFTTSEKLCFQTKHDSSPWDCSEEHIPNDDGGKRQQHNFSVKPLKSRKDPEWTRAYKAMMLRLKRERLVPKNTLWTMKCPRSRKTRYGMSVFAGTAENFWPSLWDRVLPQAEIPVNILWQSNATSNVSAYAHLSGPFDYNKMPLPLAPMECAVQMREKTDKMGTLTYHTVDG